MGEFLTIREIDQAVHAIRARIKIQPEVGMILDRDWVRWRND